MNQASGMPTMVDAMLATLKAPRVRPNGARTKRWTTNDSTMMIGTIAAHIAGRKSAAIGTPMSALADEIAAVAATATVTYRRFVMRSNDRVERPHDAPLAACRASQQHVGSQGAAHD